LGKPSFAGYPRDGRASVFRYHYRDALRPSRHRTPCAGRPEDGDATLKKAAAVLEGRSERKIHVRCLTDLVVERFAMGRFEEAQSPIAEAVARGRSAEKDEWVTRAQVCGAEVEAALGNLERAIAQSQEAIARRRAMRRLGLLGHALCDLAGYLLAVDILSDATAAVRKGLPLAGAGIVIGGIATAIGLQHLDGLSDLGSYGAPYAISMAGWYAMAISAWAVGLTSRRSGRISTGAVAFYRCVQCGGSPGPDVGAIYGVVRGL